MKLLLLRYFYLSFMIMILTGCGDKGKPAVTGDKKFFQQCKNCKNGSTDQPVYECFHVAMTNKKDFADPKKNPCFAEYCYRVTIYFITCDPIEGSETGDCKVDKDEKLVYSLQTTHEQPDKVTCDTKVLPLPGIPGAAACAIDFGEEGKCYINTCKGREADVIFGHKVAPGAGTDERKGRYVCGH